jgi:hypothetical protein
MTDFSNSFTIFNSSGSATGNAWTEEVSYLGQEKWLLRLRDDPAFSSDIASDQDVEERSSANLVEWVIDMDQVDGEEFHRVHALLDAAKEVGSVECATLLQRFLNEQVTSDKYQNTNLSQLFTSTIEAISPASIWGEKICPTPVLWAPLHQTLIAHAKTNHLPPPPMPLILAGWNFSSDEEKKARWLETVSWCESHQCVHLLASLKDADWYDG